MHNGDKNVDVYHLSENAWKVLIQMYPTRGNKGTLNVNTFVFL